MTVTVFSNPSASDTLLDEGLPLPVYQEVLHHSKKSQERKKKKQGQQVIHLKKAESMKNGVNFQRITTGISKVA